jgi:hypothetical protein
VHLSGYGVVFSTEVGLVTVPPLTPFNPSYTKEEISKIHQRKLAKLPQLKQAMREMLVLAAGALEGLAPDEQIVVAVTLFYFNWEDRTGLPSQVLLRAAKRDLAGKTANQIPASAISVEEF